MGRVTEVCPVSEPRPVVSQIAGLQTHSLSSIQLPGLSCSTLAAILSQVYQQV